MCDPYTFRNLRKPVGIPNFLEVRTIVLPYTITIAQKARLLVRLVTPLAFTRRVHQFYRRILCALQLDQCQFHVIHKADHLLHLV